jgi:anti-sigma factor RsiW
MALPAAQQLSVFTHSSEHDLESYVMGKMPATDQTKLEVHTLICPACCEALAQTFRYVEAIRAALRGTGVEDPNNIESPRPRDTGGIGRSPASEG